MIDVSDFFIGQQVKLVYKDGNSIYIKNVLVKDSNNNFYLFKDLLTKRDFSVNKKDINKMEVVENDNLE